MVLPLIVSSVVLLLTLLLIGWILDELREENKNFQNEIIVVHRELEIARDRADEAERKLNKIFLELNS